MQKPEKELRNQGLMVLRTFRSSCLDIYLSFTDSDSDSSSDESSSSSSSSDSGGFLLSLCHRVLISSHCTRFSVIHVHYHLHIDGDNDSDSDDESESVPKAGIGAAKRESSATLSTASESNPGKTVKESSK